PKAARASALPDAMNTQFLTQVAMFFGLEQAALQDLCRCLSPRQVRPGDVLCRAGEAATSLFILQRGVAEVVLDAPGNGTATRRVARLRRGDVIGELALLTSEPRSATVVARLPTTVLELKRADFLTLLEHYPIVLGNLVRVIGHRLVQRN